MSVTEWLRRFHRLRRSEEFSRCYRRGLRKHGRYSAVYLYRTYGRCGRLGVTVSRKVGNSVIRHRLKRRVREIFRRSESRANFAGWDLVVHLKEPARLADYDSFEGELLVLLKSVFPSRGESP